MADSEYVSIHVDEVRQETEMALALVIGGETFWVDRAAIRDPDRFWAGDTDLSMEIRREVAREKGIGNGR